MYAPFLYRTFPPFLPFYIFSRVSATKSKFFIVFVCKKKNKKKKVADMCSYKKISLRDPYINNVTIHVPSDMIGKCWAGKCACGNNFALIRLTPALLRKRFSSDRSSLLVPFHLHIDVLCNDKITLFRECIAQN